MGLLKWPVRPIAVPAKTVPAYLVNWGLAFVDDGPVPTEEHSQRIRTAGPRLADQVTVGCVGGGHNPPYT
ncbi:MAG: hypothetical protein CL878_08790 [Dehalococcoidia bacterium]|nr:hypothetical protein [Dehalococcoidia bacterium]